MNNNDLSGLELLSRTAHPEIKSGHRWDSGTAAENSSALNVDR
jgi:hypothetical protein